MAATPLVPSDTLTQQLGARSLQELAHELTHGAHARDAKEDEAASVRGALVVSSFVSPVLLLVSGLLQANGLRAETRDALTLTALASAVPAYLALGGALVAHVRGRAAHAEEAGQVPVPDRLVLGTAAAALLVSTVAAMTGRGELVFDAGCVALAVATAGRVCEKPGARSVLVPLAAIVSAAVFAFTLRSGNLAWSPLFAAACLAPVVLVARAVARSGRAFAAGMGAAGLVLGGAFAATSGGAPGVILAAVSLLATAASIAAARLT
jgi:hypothetical protein